MKLLILENLEQLKNCKFNLKEFEIITTSGVVSEKLSLNSIPFKIFNISKILSDLTKKEDHINRLFYKTLENLEKYLKKEKKLIDQRISCNFSKLNMYHFQFMIHEINTRYSILDSIIKDRFRNFKKIYIFNEIKPIYKFDNYKFNPWINIILKKYKKKIKIININKKNNKNERINSNFSSSFKNLSLEINQGLKNIFFKTKKILFFGNTFFSLQKLEKNNKFSLMSLPIDCGDIDYDYHWFKFLKKKNYIKFENNRRKNIKIIKNIDKFKQESLDSKKLNSIVDFDFLEILKLHLVNFFLHFPKVIFLNHTVLNQVLKKNDIDFFLINSSTHWLYKYASIYFHLKKIPTVSLQHGGGYGTHNYPKNEFNDVCFSDYFLTYGKFFQSRKNSLFKKKAKIFHVRDDYMEFIDNKFKYNKAPKKIKNLLFISDGNSLDLICSSKRKQDDLSLYLKQKDLFENISKNLNIKITYRPFGNENSGIVDYLKQNHSNIKLDNKTNIYEQIINNDLILTDSSPGTILNQCLYFEKKVIFFTFNNDSYFFEKFMNIIKKSCYVVNNDKRNNFIKNNIKNNNFSFLSKINSSFYKKKYLTNKDNMHISEALFKISNLNKIKR